MNWIAQLYAKPFKLSGSLKKYLDGVRAETNNSMAFSPPKKILTTRQPDAENNALYAQL
jgi:hypothetical protein